MKLADAGTRLVLDVFALNGALLAAGERIAGDEGLTSARWQVLGAVALADGPLSVPQIGRRMGLTRQSVQVSVNHLVDDGLLAAGTNEHHRRSPLFALTADGVAVYARLAAAQEHWIAGLVDGLAGSDVAAASTVLRALTDRLAGAGTEEEAS